MFLAAISSSRSDDVTNSVCVSLCGHFVNFGDFEVLWGVTRVSYGCLKSVSREF